MIGALIGDYAGSYYEEIGLEGRTLKSYNLPIDGARFRVTDDSIMTAAVADALMNGNEFSNKFVEWYQRFPNHGFSNRFCEWAEQKGTVKKGSSYGNGAAVRAGLIGYMKGEDFALEMAERSAVSTHNHEEGLAGAKAMAWTVWALRNDISHEDIKSKLYQEYDYYIDYDAKKLNKEMVFDSSAVNTVPIAIWVALQSRSFIDAIRMCLYIGGDTDSIGAMAGLLAQQRFPLHAQLEFQVREYVHVHMNPMGRLLHMFEGIIERNGCWLLNNKCERT